MTTAALCSRAARIAAASRAHSSSSRAAWWNWWRIVCCSVLRQLLLAHQRLDVVAVAGVRGHAPGRGVRVRDVALLLQRAPSRCGWWRRRRRACTSRRARSEPTGWAVETYSSTMILEELLAAFCKHISYLN